jgi:hypothetical protein
MRYVNSTTPQMIRLCGAWLLGFGLAFLLLTMGELEVEGPPRGFETAGALAVLGGAFLVVGTLRARVAMRANRAFFSANAGTDILAARRRTEHSAKVTRNVLFLVAVLLGVMWIVLAATYTCEGSVCGGFVADQGAWVDRLRVVTILVGLATLIFASFARLHEAESDRWEEYASDALRRRNEGPIPGMPTSRWE